jgi:hypothetical protein
MRPEDVRFDVRGTLTGVQADKVIPGRVLAAESLVVEADNGQVRLSGSATLDGVPAEGSWRQTLGPPGTGRSTTVAQIEVTPAALAAFGMNLPEGAVRGAGRADAVVEITAGGTPAFRMESTLEGLDLAIPEIGWTKPAAEAGRLSVRGRFAQPTEIEALSLSAAGLDASGTLRLTTEGALESAEFGEVAVGDWFAGSVTLTGQGQGAPVRVSVTGGSADMRRAQIGAAGSGAADRPATDVSLSELRLTDGIALTDFRGTFSAISGGTGGQFAGWVNGSVPVAGDLAPDASGRPVIRLQSEDAGAVLAAAGVYSSGRGGEMDLVLRSLGARGSYDGSIGIRNIRVVDAPGLASLLNAVSVVGLIDELRGAGIVFTDVEGNFGLMPDGVEIRQGSAIGPSLGVSLEGVYRAEDESIDLRGVVSPLYLLNGIGQIFSRQRDGLFGFAYQLSGRRTDYEVAVNPLSILTPGMFRDIFRRPPPSFSAPSGG